MKACSRRQVQWRCQWSPQRRSILNHRQDFTITSTSEFYLQMNERISSLCNITSSFEYENESGEKPHVQYIDSSSCSSSYFPIVLLLKSNVFILFLGHFETNFINSINNCFMNLKQYQQKVCSLIFFLSLSLVVWYAQKRIYF